MDTPIFQLQATDEIMMAMFWWAIFKQKRLLYFMHLQEVIGYAVRPAFQKAKSTPRKEIIKELIAAGYNDKE